MSNIVDIPRLETGVVRVFDVALDGAAAKAFAEDPAAQARALGLPSIDADYVRVFPVSDLAGLGLSAYLTEGLGIAPARIDPDRDAIDSLTGHVTVLTSKAFGDGGVTLRVVPPLRLVATFAEETPPVSFSPLPSGSAEGTLTASPVAPPPPPLRGGSWGLILALAVLAIGAVAIAVTGNGP